MFEELLVALTSQRLHERVELMARCNPGMFVRAYGAPGIYGSCMGFVSAGRRRLYNLPLRSYGLKLVKRSVTYNLPHYATGNPHHILIVDQDTIPDDE